MTRAVAMEERARRPRYAKRLFFALVPPRELQRELAAATDAALAADPRGADFRPVPVEEVHLTLLFLGDVAAERAAELAALFVERARGLAAPALTVRGTGAFPDARRARVLWVGLDDPGGALAELHAAVADAARAVGWRADPAEERKPFAAHVTVARARGRGGRPPPMPAAFARIDLARAWTPDAIVLVESHLERRERRHEPIARAPLDGARG